MEEGRQQPKRTTKQSFSSTLRRLSCTSSTSSEAYTPSSTATSAAAASTVRSSAEWQGKKTRRKRIIKQHKNKDKKNNNSSNSEAEREAAEAEAWFDRRMADDFGRGGRRDAERIQREIMMFQTRIMSSGMHVYDRYRDWRLNVDRMSYEELLELGDRIGHVSTGLREEEISRSVRRMKPLIFDVSPLYFSTEMERKCSICQEEYEVNDEMGKLECGHSYHVYCIKQWLLQKNACPVCKTAVAKT